MSSTVIPSFADQCGINTQARQAEVQRVLALAQASGLEWIRLVWCDVHGSLRGKTWVTSELANAFSQGMGMVSTLMLKDTSDRTVYKVFEADVKHELPGFEGASNVMLLPDPAPSKFCLGPKKQLGCCANLGFRMAKLCPMTRAVCCKPHWKNWPPKAGACVVV